MATSRPIPMFLEFVKPSLFGLCMLAFSLLNAVVFVPPAAAQTFENLLSRHAPLIYKSSSKTVAPVLAKITDFGGPIAQKFLLTWRSKDLYFLKESGQFAYAQKLDDGRLKLINVETGAGFATVTKAAIKQIKPNSGVRAKISASLVPFLLASADPDERAASLDALARDFNESHLALLDAAIKKETNAALKRRLARAYRFGLIGFGRDEDAVVAAIYGLEGDLSLETRAVLNPLLTDNLYVAAKLPEGINLARIIVPGKTIKLADGAAGRQSIIGGAPAELSVEAAYNMLVDAAMCGIL